MDTRSKYTIEMLNATEISNPIIKEFKENDYTFISVNELEQSNRSSIKIEIDFTQLQKDADRNSKEYIDAKQIEPSLTFKEFVKTSLFTHLSDDKFEDEYQNLELAWNQKVFSLWYDAISKPHLDYSIQNIVKKIDAKIKQLKMEYEEFQNVIKNAGKQAKRDLDEFIALTNNKIRELNALKKSSSMTIDQLYSISFRYEKEKLYVDVVLSDMKLKLINGELNIPGSITSSFVLENTSFKLDSVSFDDDLLKKLAFNDKFNIIEELEAKERINYIFYATNWYKDSLWEDIKKESEKEVPKNDRDTFVNHIIMQDKVSHPKKISNSCFLAAQKYIAVTAIQEKLVQKDKSSIEKLCDAESVFKQNKNLINRDTKAFLFIKAVTLILMGIIPGAHLLPLPNVLKAKGVDVSKKIGSLFYKKNKNKKKEIPSTNSSLQSKRK